MLKRVHPKSGYMWTSNVLIEFSSMLVRNLCVCEFVPACLHLCVCMCVCTFIYRFNIVFNGISSRITTTIAKNYSIGEYNNIGEIFLNGTETFFAVDTK